MELWELVRFLHIVALAVFVGGQILLIVAIVPGLRGEPDEVMLRVAQRFGLASAVAILLLLATGIAMASHFARWGDSTLQAKLAVIALVGVLTGLHIAAPRARAVAIALTASSLLVVWLGVVLAH
jgi:putative copper export protein